MGASVKGSFHCHNAKPPLLSVVEAVQQWLPKSERVPFAPFTESPRLIAEIEGAYRSIYTLLGADEGDTFIFTSSAEEAKAHLFTSLWIDFMREEGKNQILTSNMEEATTYGMVGRLKPLGCVGKEISVGSDGLLDVKELEQHINPRTALLSISWNNHLTGALQPIWEIAALCEKRDIFLHVDVSDVLGEVFFRFADLPIDFLSFDGPRAYGPRGSGGLFIKKGRTLSPLIPGGIPSTGLRGGELNFPALIGLGAACDELIEKRDQMSIELAQMRDLFERTLEQELDGVTIIGKDIPRLPSLSAISFEGVHGELLLYHLAREGVYGTFGGGSSQKLDVMLEKMGYFPTVAYGALSFCFPFGVDRASIKKAAHTMIKRVTSLRKHSSYWFQKSDREKHEKISSRGKTDE